MEIHNSLSDRRDFLKKTIAGAGLAMDGIDDSPAAKLRQHQAASRQSDAAISSSAAAALGKSLRAPARRNASDWVSRAKSIAS